MKKELVIENIKKLLENIEYKQEDKHKSINCSLVIVFKMKNKTMKFMQNFAVEVPHGFQSTVKPVIFCSEEKFNALNLNSEFTDKIILGSTLDPKKIKRSIKWALVDGEFNIEKWKNSLNRKSILPNNIASFEEVNIEDSIKKILNSNTIKIIQMNNSFSFKAGSFAYHSPIQILENIEVVYNFISGKLGNLIARVYINKTMKKSLKVCVR